MSINPVIACLVVVAALGTAQGVTAQNRPPAPAASSPATNAPAPLLDRMKQQVTPRTRL
jgi:hypothetical protein